MFGSDASRGREDRKFDAELLEEFVVAADPVELLLRPEQLQRALLALVILDAGARPQVAQAVAAVLGDLHTTRDRDHRRSRISRIRPRASVSISLSTRTRLPPA